MTITKEQNGSTLTIALEGRLDANAAPDLTKELHDGLDGVTELYFDLKQLDYISSAGLRAMLTARKAMKGKGKMALRHVSPQIMDILEVTGFTDVLNIE